MTISANSVPQDSPLSFAPVDLQYQKSALKQHLQTAQEAVVLKAPSTGSELSILVEVLSWGLVSHLALGWLWLTAH